MFKSPGSQYEFPLVGGGILIPEEIDHFLPGSVNCLDVEGSVFFYIFEIGLDNSALSPLMARRGVSGFLRVGGQVVLDGDNVSPPGRDRVN